MSPSSVGGLADAEHRRRPAARRRHGPQPVGAQAGDGGLAPSAGRRRSRRARRRRRRSRPPARRSSSSGRCPGRAAAAPRRAPGASGSPRAGRRTSRGRRGRRRPGRARSTAAGQRLGLVEAAGADRQHHVDRLGEVAQAVVAIDLQPLAQLGQRAAGAAVARQDEVDGPPGQAHQAVDRATGPTGRRRSARRPGAAAALLWCGPSTQWWASERASARTTGSSASRARSSSASAPDGSPSR